MTIQEFGKIFWEEKGISSNIEKRTGLSDRGVRYWKANYAEHLKQGYNIYINYSKQDGRFIPVGLLDKEGKTIPLSFLGEINDGLEIEIPPLEQDDEKLILEDQLSIFKQQVGVLTKQLRHEKAHTRIIIDTLKSVITPIVFTPNQYKEDKEEGKIEEVAVLNIADLHCGKNTPSFSPEVLVKRLKILEEAVIKIVDGILRNSYKIDTLRIHVHGDLVDGDNIYPGHNFNVSFDAVTGIFVSLVPALANLILNLRCFFKNIIIVAVPGNHGRTSGFSSAKTANWDLVLYNSLQCYLKEYDDIKWNIACFLEEDNENIGKNRNKYFILRDGPFLLTHGDIFKMNNSVPWSSITQRVIKYSSRLPGLKVFSFGHFHIPIETRINGVQVFGIPSAVTDDDFALEKLGEFSEARQLIYGWNPKKQRTTWSFPIDIDERHEELRIPSGMGG